MKLKFILLLTVSLFCVPNFYHIAEGNLNEKLTERETSPQMSVTLQVWDAKNERWVDKLRVPVSSELKFRVYVHNTGNCDLFDIDVKCHLPSSLKYVNNSSSPYEPYEITNNTLIWIISSLSSYCGGEYFETFYKARIIDEGWSINKLEVVAHYQDGAIAIVVSNASTVYAFLDENPPSLKILKPKPGLYLSDRRIFPLLKSIIIFGKITIEVETYDEEFIVDKVEVFVDGRIMANLSEKPYRYTWNENVRGRHEIMVVSCDFAGNCARKNLIVWKLF